MRKDYRFKSIRKSTIILLIIMTSLLMAVIYAVTDRVMVNVIKQQEKEDVIKHLDTVVNEIDKETVSLQSIGLDWGAWDDTYEFAEDGNKAYIDDNLFEEGFENLDLNLMVITDKSGQFVFAKELMPGRQYFQAISDDLKETLGKSGVLGNMDINYKLKGIIMLSDGAMLIASQPIITSRNQGPVNGNLIFGRILDDAGARELSRLLNMEISFEKTDNSGNNIQRLVSGAESVEVNEISKSQVSGRTILKDIYGQPCLALNVVLPRDIYKFGEANITYLMCILAFVILVFCMVIIMYLEKNILLRLLKLSNDILEMGNKIHTGSRLEAQKKKDEIYILTEGINHMLDKLDEFEKKIRNSEEKYRTFVEKGTEIIYSLDPKGTISYISPNCASLLGYSDDEIIGKPLSFLVFDEDKPKWHEVLKDANGIISGKDGCEFRTILKYGSLRWFNTRISIVNNSIGSNSYIGILNDIQKRKMVEEELRKAHDELELKVRKRTEELSITNEKLKKEISEKEIIQEKIMYIAYHDYLTGLPNRQLFVDRLDHAILTSGRLERPLGVIFLDLDDFKLVNDTMGHEHGDELLKKVAQRLMESLRKEDTIARFGGDEFVILVQNLTNVEDIILAVEKVIGCLIKPFKMKNQDIYITGSVGIAMFPMDGEDVNTLLKNADIAMYRAKERGKNQYALCTPLMKTKVVETMKITNSLYRALERDEFIVYYQPQIQCSTGEIVGFEALLRWNNPEMGLVSPTQFIPVAEHTGLIIPIGEWVLKQACIQNRKWHEQGLGSSRIAVNLSLVQLKRGSIVSDIKNILDETGLLPKYLELEITESVAMNEDIHFEEIFKELKELGIKISIDDFGTEYSSLTRLKDMPIDRIKIAMPFIQGITANEKDEAIVKTLITLAKSLNVKIIAEGVENEQEYEFLYQHHCDEIQGYYFYRAMCGADIDKILYDYKVKK